MTVTPEGRWQMTANEPKVAVRRRGDVAVLDIVGDIDRTVDAPLQQAYDQAVTDGGQAVLLNFGEVGDRDVAPAADRHLQHHPTVRLHRHLPGRGHRDGLRRRQRGARGARRGAVNQRIQKNATMDVRQVNGAVSVVDIRGDVTAASETALGEAYAAASTPTTAAVVLNFTGLEYMNSGGIGMLVTLLVRANRQRQRLLAYGLNQHYRQIFELTRLDEAIGIHDSEDAAVAAVDAR